MGVSGSAPVAPHNKHLAHVSDPRSPSAGIFRTPIEVGALPPAFPRGGPRPAAPTRLALSAGGELPGGQPSARCRRAGGGEQAGPGPAVAHARCLPHSQESGVEW